MDSNAYIDLEGRLIRAAEVQKSQTSEKTIVRFTVQVNTGLTRTNGEPLFNLYDVAYLGKDAAEKAKLLHQGTMVRVCGFFYQKKTNYRDAPDKYRLKVKTEDVTILGGKQTGILPENFKLDTGETI